MKNLMVFEGNNVEVFEFDGKVLFNPYHVGNCLGLSSVTVRRHIQDMNEKQVIKLTNPVVQNLNIRKLNNAGENFLTEKGVYVLVFKSKKEEALKFQDWVTDEVLPAIRVTGGYIPVSKEDSDAEIMAKALMIAQKTIDKKDELIKELQPKSDWFDEFINSKGLFTSTQMAKLLKITSGQKFNKMMNELGLIYKQGKAWFPYANTNEEWFKLIVGSNNEHSYSQLKFTPTGVVEISKLMNIELTKEDLKDVM